MFISYEKLWALLLARGMKKTDLLPLCGISSRTLSKLSKGENVNTDTLLAICEGLGCGLDEIMALCRAEDAPTLWRAFCMQKPAYSDEYFENYEFTYHGRRIVVRKTREKANRKTIIRCIDNKVVWEQIYPLGISPTYVKKPICGSFWEKDTVGILVISGDGCGFQGLDDGLFISWRKIPKPGEQYIYLMSEPRFKAFELTEPEKSE